MARPPRRARRPADWVYRPHIRDEAGVLIEGLGSYEATFSTLTVGANNAQVRILYDSFNYRSMQLVDTAGINFPQGYLGPSAKAEGRNPLIRRVEAFITYQPTSWSVGDQLHIGFRFGIFEQDPTSGLVLLDPAYTLMNPSASTLANPAVFANSRTWQFEKRIKRAFASNDARFESSFRIRVNRLLKPHECYALYVEGQVGHVNTSMQYWCRTLVSDEG